MQVGGFWSLKKWDISGKKKTAQDAALWTSETQIIPGLDPGQEQPWVRIKITRL